MIQCSTCNLTSDHPFGLRFDESGLCSGCVSYFEKKKNLEIFGSVDFETLSRKLFVDLGKEINRAIVPLQFDNETHFVIECLIKMGIRPTVVYFNAQYHDQITFDYMSRLQELFDVDFVGFTLPKTILQKLVIENIISGMTSISMRKEIKLLQTN